MLLYLIRHGEYMPASVDHREPLSPQGRKDIHAVARLIGESGPEAAQAVWHSPKNRALQSAKIIQDVLLTPGGIQARDDVSPNADPQACIKAIDRSRQTLIIVSHLPFIPQLLWQLMPDDVHEGGFRFPAGSLAVVRCDGDGKWRLEEILTPETYRV
ncbi:MAG: SixA phosphatase family protein [Candidatus Omnitrophota bacterium]